MRTMPRAARGATLVALALVAGACGSGGGPPETAPPPTPLPSLRTPTVLAGPSDSPDPGAREAADPDSAFQQLRASVPAGLVSRCERATPPRGAIARVECRPASGADTLSYLLFDGEGPLLDAYRERLGELPAGALDGPGCGRGPGSERLADGRRACHREGGGAAVTWTNELVYVLARAHRDDGDWSALEAFWKGAGPVTP